MRLDEAKRVVSAAVIVQKDDAILLLQRGDTAPWMPGKWNLPGGTVDPGENPAKSAAREAREEASIHVGGLKKVAKVNLGKELGLVHVYHTRKFSGEPKIDWESKAFRWVPLAQAAKMALVPGIRQAILKVAKSQGKQEVRVVRMYGPLRVERRIQ